MRCSIPFVFFLAGCAAGAPHWAHDTLSFLPSDSGIIGTQTWRIYAKGWRRNFNDKHRLCVMEFDLALVSSEARCPTCEVAFEAWPVRTASDCLPLASQTLTSTRYVGVESSATGLSSWIDVGFGWEPHSAEQSGVSWPPGEAIDFPSDFVWELEEATTAASGFETGRREGWSSSP